MDKVAAHLEVGSLNGEIIINHPDLQPDEKGVGHIVFSPRQARNLADLLMRHANLAEAELVKPKTCANCGERGRHRGDCPDAPAPTDWSARTLTDDSPVTEDHKEIIQEGMRKGQQKGYVVLSLQVGVEEEKSRSRKRNQREI